MDADEQAILLSLLTEQRHLALAVDVDGEPYAGLLPFVAQPDLSALLIHASDLARHSRGLGDGARYAAVVAAPEDPDGDPLQRPRVSVQGEARRLPRGSAAYDEGAALYQARFPGSGMTFQLGDFNLIALTVERGRLVVGFGAAYNIGPRTLRELLAAPPAS